MAAESELEQKKLKRASIIANSMTGVLTIALFILWPMPLYGSEYIFSKKFFTDWVSVGMLWLFCSSLAVDCSRFAREGTAWLVRLRVLYET